MQAVLELSDESMPEAVNDMVDTVAKYYGWKQKPMEEEIPILEYNAEYTKGKHTLSICSLDLMEYVIHRGPLQWVCHSLPEMIQYVQTTMKFFK